MHPEWTTSPDLQIKSSKILKQKKSGLACPPSEAVIVVNVINIYKNGCFFLILPPCGNFGIKCALNFFEVHKKAKKQKIFKKIWVTQTTLKFPVTLGA